MEVIIHWLIRQFRSKKLLRVRRTGVPCIPVATCAVKLLMVWALFLPVHLFAQTSWKGTVSTAWSNSANWTAGVPTATIDAIIGNASFTGAFSPNISSSANCKSLTVGAGVNATLTVSKNLTVAGNLTIAAGSTISQKGVTLTVTGNWSNSGTYTTTSSTARVTFAGTTQSIGGTAVTPFRRLTIGTGSTTTQNVNMTVAGTLTINGFFIPADVATPVVVSGAGTTTVNQGGVLHVNASTYAGNYGLTGTVTLAAGSIVEYSDTLTSQTVRNNLTYSTLRISGRGTKTLGGNLNALNSTTAAVGNIEVLAGTLDLTTFTANRGTTVAGGGLTVANGATLKVGGTSNFPINFGTVSLSLTSIVEYNGTNQTVTAATYGNLTLSSGSGAAVKTMPATAITISGNLTSVIGSGTSVSYTAAANITVSGNVNIGTSTTFNGGSFTVTTSGNWVNNGTFSGGTGTVTFTGGGTSISGSGTHTFNNLTAAATNITAAASTSLTLSGNLTTTAPGTFTHLTGGTLTMNGSSKTITGTGISLENLTISGTVSAATGISITGNLSVAGSFTNTSGSVIMSGAGKTISGAGTIGFASLSLSGSITSSAGFSISNTLDVSGSFSASAGTTTFTGTSSLNGTANLFNVTLNGTSLQLSTNSILGIANTYTVTAGTLDVTSTIPNTVNFNGTGAQTVAAGTFNKLVVSNGNTKTLGGTVTVNSDFTISSGTTFNGSSQSLSLLGDWINNGTFTASTGTVTLSGAANTAITGASTFNILTINKSATTNQVTLLSNISVGTVNMTSGTIITGVNTLTITSNRSGNGIILGTIQHSHTFNLGTAYAFESPNNTVTLTGLTTSGTITVSVTPQTVADFPSGAAINREYNITTGGGITLAATTLRFHYEDAELNGNTESSLTIWRNTGSGWSVYGNSASSTTSNYVEQFTLLALSFTGRYTMASTANVVRWNGSVSTDWNTAANWTIAQGSPSRPPGVNDIAEIGTISFTNQPTISSSVNIKSISFGSVEAATLTLAAGGSLTTQGNIAGIWAANAAHTINVNDQNLTVNGGLVLSDGTAGHTIQLNVGNGNATIAGSVTQSGSAGIACSGTGTLNIGGDFNYSNGTFTAGSGTVNYNGSAVQSVAGLTYNHLTINKSAGSAQINSATTVNGNLTVSSGNLGVNAATTVTGDFGMSAGATANGGSAAITVGGNWNNSGTFTPTTGSVNFTGSNTQTISSTTFNNLVINKTGGTASLTGNVVINGNLSLNGGTMGLSTFTANRSALGGVLSIANGATLTAGGAGNFPANYSQYQLGNTSTVNYNAAGAQTVSGNISYGHLTLSGSGTKSLANNITINGDLLISSGATFSAGAFTTNLYGNWNNSGSFSGGTGTVTLNGSSKTITGNTTFNRLTVYGSYAVAGSDITYNGLLQITTGGSYDGGSGSATVNGDLTNSGSLISNGITTFSGTSLQTIRFLNAVVSNSSGVINFNGNVSPILNSTSTPTYATLNINNTAGINPSVNWLVLVAFNISNGAIFNGGLPTHTIRGSFTNNGTVTSSGTLYFNPIAPQNITLTGTSFSSTGNVIFGGNVALTVSGAPTSLTDVTIANTAGVTPNTNWNINGDLHINGGAIFNAGSNTFTVNNDIESNGTLNGGTSTFNMTSPSGTLTGSDGTTFYNLIINGTVLTDADFNIEHNFTINGAFDASIGTPTMTGATAAVIGGTASPFNLAQLEVQKATTATVTLARSLRLMTSLAITGGTLDAGDSTIIQDPAGGGLLSIDDSTRLIVRGVFSLPAFDSYLLDTLSTVEYAGSTQTVSSATAYGNLTISAAGTKTATAALTILNDFTLSNGTFVPGSFTDTLRGNWNMTGGTFTNTGSAIYFSGSADQSVSSTGAFNHFKVNKSTGLVSLAANATINGTLTFMAGKIRTGSNTVIIPAAGTVTGAGQSTGWVYGRLQKNVASGSNISRLYEIGDTLNYTPATALFASVSTAGDVLATVTPASHPNLPTSGLNTSKKVTRYWTLTNSGAVFTTATVTLNWVAADVDAGATTANFKAARYSGGTWTLPAVSAPLSTSIQVTGLTALGDLAVGELSTGSIWTGAVSTSWYVTGNWSSAAVPVSTTNVTIPTGLTNYPLINTGTAIANNITIQTGATVTVSSAILRIGGVISNTGTFTATAGTIELNGAGAQTIPAATFATNTLSNLIVNNTSGVSLGGTLNISGILKITVGQLTTGGNLTLLSTATQTALIDGSGAGQVTGNVTIQRYIPSAFGYKYFSSPVQAATVNEFADDVNLNATFPSFYRYVENRTSSGWVAYTSTSGALTPMQGYAAQMGTSNTPLTADITGVVNNQTVTAPALTNNNQPYTQGFNLVGNPYPSPVDWDAATGWTRTNVDNAVYYFNAGTADQYTGTYSSYINGVSSDGIANNLIGSMQGFFVHVSNGAFPVTGTLAVNNNARVNNLSPVFHRVPVNSPILRLSAAFADDGGPADPLVVYFDAAASPSFEKTMDALKLMNTATTVPNVYAMATDGSRLSINAWPQYPDSTDVIPLGLKTERTGWITFNTVDIVHMPDQLHIYLKDEVTGHTEELLQYSKYRVYLEAGSYEKRFSLVFRNGREITPPSEEPVFRAYSTGKTLYGYFDKVPGEKCRISISNVSGQILWWREVTGNGQQHVIGRQYSSGIYIVSFHANDKVVSKKVIIMNQQ
ncbi:T9SS type A sorting domain-containing protein [Chitinophaga sp. 22321]|uniref:T9SS type A sorting domain-containing protein n=1 Tax=Chitinophaga hostae TaxID=2831022 RepID=A0ABS5IXY7_9BACT|nr:T9SS type A sorting domain-containing protein [Chitinophaga hostae]MBS0027750.1 T9SS type A sorting domain-containing protein [Chitinophaga hostae]